MLHFPRSEFDMRIASTRTELARNGLDALLIFAQESHYYLTGFDTSSGYKFFQCAILTAIESPITLLTRRPDLIQARRTSTIEDIRIWYDAEGLNPAAELKALLEEKNLRGTRIGVELATSGMTGAHWELLRTTLSDWCYLVDASSLIQLQRAIKSDLEVTYVRRAAEIADLALLRLYETAKPDVAEAAVEAAICSAVLSEDGDIVGAKVALGSGPKALVARVSTGGRVMKDGEQLTLEWAGVFRRYHAGIFRTLSIGRAKSEHRALFRTVNEALQAMTEVTRPGVPLGKIADEHRRIFEEAGFTGQRESGAGYSVGATFPPRGLPDTPPLIYAGNQMPAQPGMTLFLHAMYANEDTHAAMMLGYTVLVTPDGCEVLSKLVPEYHECV